MDRTREEQALIDKTVWDLMGPDCRGTTVIRGRVYRCRNKEGHIGTCQCEYVDGKGDAAIISWDK